MKLSFSNEPKYKRTEVTTDGKIVTEMNVVEMNGDKIQNCTQRHTINLQTSVS